MCMAHSCISINHSAPGPGCINRDIPAGVRVMQMQGGHFVYTRVFLRICSGVHKDLEHTSSASEKKGATHTHTFTKSPTYPSQGGLLSPPARVCPAYPH